MKVMIVEDQTMIRSLLESYFHGVHSEESRCRTNSVDLILMDRENGVH